MQIQRPGNARPLYFGGHSCLLLDPHLRANLETTVDFATDRQPIL